jgi:hypothetical protein
MTNVMRVVSGRFFVTLLGALSSCTSPGAGGLPGKLTGAPGADPEVAKELQAARDQMLQDEGALALRGIEAILREHPDHVNALRLRQDVLRQRGRLGLVLAEAEDRVERRPVSASAQYLAGRVTETNAGKQSAFRRAIATDPTNFWGWYGLAFTLRGTDNSRANEIYSSLYAHSDHDAWVGIAFAQSLRRGGRLGDASRVYHEVRRVHVGLGAAGMAETLMRSGKRHQAWAYLLAAVQARPFDGTVHGAIATAFAQGLPDDGARELLDVLRADPERLRRFGRADPGQLADLFGRVGDRASALQVLRDAPWLAAAERHLLRRLSITGGGVAAFLADLREGAVQELLDDEANQVRGLWHTLFAGPWMRAADPLADASQALALSRALIAVGHLGFAELILGEAILRHGETAVELRNLRDDLRREIAFEAGLRRILARGYARYRGDGTAASLEKTLGKLRDLSQQTLGVDVVGEPKLFELPFVGVLVDSLGPGLPAHLAKYNKHLVMGQRNSRPSEGMILTRLSLRHVDPSAAVPLPPRTVEVIGEHRELEPFEQGDLAGIALLNHYVVDMDEVRAWAETVAARRRVSRADGDVLLRDAIPTRAARGVPAGVEWRLSLLSPVEDKDLSTAVLDIIRWHEQGHMVDFRYLLPVEWHPLRAISLTVRNGFRALAVGAEMEARAELTALAMSPHTRLVAAHIAGFLGGDGGQSPHAHGFRDLVADILDELERRGVPRSAVRHWHRVDPHTLRDVARHLLKRLW